eukprot:1143192-Pelagomonas_calceolata.AAC.8
MLWYVASASFCTPHPRSLFTAGKRPHLNHEGGALEVCEPVAGMVARDHDAHVRPWRVSAQQDQLHLLQAVVCMQPKGNCIGIMSALGARRISGAAPPKDQLPFKQATACMFSRGEHKGLVVRHQGQNVRHGSSVQEYLLLLRAVVCIWPKGCKDIVSALRTNRMSGAAACQDKLHLWWYVDSLSQRGGWQSGQGESQKDCKCM